MALVKVAQVAGVPEGAIVPVTAGGHDLLLTCVGGAFHALARKCTHMGADLCGGKIDGQSLVCPKHHAAFDVTTGAPVSPAKILFLKMTPKPLATYAVTRDGDDLLIDA